MHDHTCTADCIPPTFRYQTSEGVTFAAGDRVKFLADKLGVLLHQDDGQFVGTLGQDFVGEFVGPHPSDRLAGWFLVSVAPRTVEPGNDGCAELIRQAERDDARLFVPVHGSQIAPCG